MSLVTALVQEVTTPSATAPTVTAGTPAYTFGAWVELITSAAAPLTITALVIGGVTFGAADYIEIQIGLGGAGAEASISSHWFMWKNTASGPNVHALEVPVGPIPVLSRVSSRIRSNAAGALNLVLHYVDNMDSTHQSTSGHAYTPQAANGVTVTPNGTAWTFGSFTEITAGLSGEQALVGIVTFPGPAAGADYVYEVQLALGPAAGEVPITTLRGFHEAGSGNWGELALPAPYPVNASTRISARTRHSVGGTATVLTSLRYVGTSVLPLPSPPGGGDPGTGTDPAAGTSLCGITAPLTVWAELELDASTARWSPVLQPLNHPSTYYGGPKEPRLIAVEPFSISLSDWSGRIVTGGTSVLVDDSDGVVRALLAANTVRNKQCTLYAIDDESARAGATPWRVRNFVVNDWDLLDDRTVRLTLRDRLGIRGTSLNLTKELPVWQLDTATFPNLPPERVGQAAPWPYGLLTDEAYSMVGVVPVWYVGKRLLLDGNAWYEGLIAGCATRGPISLFGADGTGYRVKIDPSYYTTDIAFPGAGQWTTLTGTSANYRVFNNHRCTVVYFKVGSVIGEAFADGSVPVVCNLAGIEDVGDGTGNVITSLPRITVHLLNNLVLQDPPGDANWNTIPTIGSPAYSIISTSTFETVKTTSEARVAGGYLGACLLGWDLQQLASSDWIARILLGGDFDLYVNRHGQICASMEDKTLTPVKAFVDVLDVEQGSYRDTKDWSKWANRVVWDHMKRYPPPANSLFTYDTTEWLFAKDKNNDGSLETAQRDTQIFAYEDWVTRDFTLAIPDNVGQHKLARMRKAPDLVPFTTDLCGTVLNPGDTYTVTHFAGPVSTVRTYRLLAQTIDLMAGRVTLLGHDLADLP